NIGDTHRRAVLIGQEIVDLGGVFSGVRKSMKGTEPISRSLPKPGYRKWIGVQQRPAVRTDPIRRNDVSREGRPRFRVVCGSGAAEVKIGRVEKFTQVTEAHRKRRHGTRPGLLLTPANPLLRPEEKQLTLVAIELSWNVDGSTDIEAELIEPKWRGTAGFA